MSRPSVRVIKLGGSLLDWPEVTQSVRDWLAGQPPAANVVIVGGGPIVEYLRELDRHHHFSPAAVHWLAVRGMSLTAAMLAEMWSEARVVTSIDELRLANSENPQILDVERFLRGQLDSADALSCDWSVTSDSIAARVATFFKARELVLLKSTLPAAGTCRESWAESGFVDPYFPRASKDLAIRCVNLRAAGFPEIVG